MPTCLPSSLRRCIAGLRAKAGQRWRRLSCRPARLPAPRLAGIRSHRARGQAHRPLPPSCTRRQPTLRGYTTLSCTRSSSSRWPSQRSGSSSGSSSRRCSIDRSPRRPEPGAQRAPRLPIKRSSRSSRRRSSRSSRRRSSSSSSSVVGPSPIEATALRLRLPTTRRRLRVCARRRKAYTVTDRARPASRPPVASSGCEQRLSASDFPILPGQAPCPRAPECAGCRRREPSSTTSSLAQSGSARGAADGVTGHSGSGLHLASRTYIVVVVVTDM